MDITSLHLPWKYRSLFIYISVINHCAILIFRSLIERGIFHNLTEKNSLNKVFKNVFVLHQIIMKKIVIHICMTDICYRHSKHIGLTQSFILPKYWVFVFYNLLFRCLPIDFNSFIQSIIQTLWDNRYNNIAAQLWCLLVLWILQCGRRWR